MRSAPRNGWVLVYGHDGRPLPAGLTEHIAHWDPARVLAECDAKRRIVEEHRAVEFTNAIVTLMSDVVCHGSLSAHPCQTLRLLASPYSDRPGYLDVWRPDAPSGL